MTLMELALPYAAVFVLAFAVVAALEPWLIRWSHRKGIVDQPGERRINTKPVARLGGAAFVPAIALGLGVVYAVWPHLWHPHHLGLLIGALILAAVGMYDDIADLRAVYKLFGQIAAASAVYWGGYGLSPVTLPYISGEYHLGPADFVLTVFFIVMVINAINMIDGLDGLAAGSAFIMAAFLLTGKFIDGLGDRGLLAVIVLGIAAAFLYFNFHPARVFMGDTGAMLLGLLLAADALESTSQGAAVTTLMLPVVVLLIPVFDLVRTALNRARIAKHPFKADKSHLHHHLLQLGFGHREVVIFIYLLNIYTGIMALLYAQVNENYRSLYLFSLALFLFITFYIIGMGGRRNGVFERDAASNRDASDDEA